MNWQERAEKAEAELARMREQEPVAYVKYKATGGNVGLSWLAVPTGEFYPREGEPLYAAPVPAVAAPAVPDNNWKRFTDDDLAEIHQLSYELGGTDSGEYLLDGDQLDQIVVKCASLFYALPVKAAPAPAVPEEWREVLVEIALRCTDHDATDAIDALLQSAPAAPDAADKTFAYYCANRAVLNGAPGELKEPAHGEYIDLIPDVPAPEFRTSTKDSGV